MIDEYQYNKWKECSYRVEFEIFDCLEIVRNLNIQYDSLKEDIRKWCNENFNEQWYLSFPNVYGFTTENDATLFILRWGTILKLKYIENGR